MRVKSPTPLLDYLFDFLNKKILNHTLAGYFSKFVLFLLDNQEKDLMEYFY